MKLISTLQGKPVSMATIAILVLIFNNNLANAQVCASPGTTIYGLNGSGILYPITIPTGVVGAAMSPAYTGNAPSSANGLGLNVTNGKFYYFKRNPSTAPGEFVSYDPSTGVVTLLAACPTVNTIHTGCISFNGNGYYCNDINGTFYYYDIPTNTWTTLTSTIYDNSGNDITAVIAARTSGDMCIDGLGNLWFVCSGAGTYGLYEFSAPLPTHAVANMKAKQIIDPNTAMPSGTGFQGAAFSPTGDLYLATGSGDNKLYQLTSFSTLTYLTTLTLDGVGNDLTSCNFPFAILPVLWKGISVEALGNEDVKIRWSLSKESGLKGFHIERKNDSGSWEEIGFVPGGNNSAAGLSYAFDDYHPYSGINYYRLREEDINGSSVYSSIKLVNLQYSDHPAVWPNPVRDQVQIIKPVDGNTESAAQVYDLSGRQLIAFHLHTGTNTVDVSYLPSGSYLLRIKLSDGSFYNQKLIKN